jgi:hypothetical protein
MMVQPVHWYVAGCNRISGLTKIAQEAEAVEEAMNSNWTKPAEKKLIQFRQGFFVTRPGVWDATSEAAVQLSSCTVTLK